MAVTTDNMYFINGVETNSAADVQAALSEATSGISISVWNGDLTFSGDYSSAGSINLNVGGTSDGTYEGKNTTNWCTEFLKDNTLSSTVTFNSDFKGTVAVYTGTNSENDAYSDSTAENANMRLIFDGAEVTGGNFYNFNYGYIEFKNGAKFDNKSGTGHIRGDVLVTGEGTDVKIALERVYGDDFGADNIVTATLTVADGARFYDTVGDANVLNLGKTTSNRQGKIIINGGTYQSKCTIAFATYGTISISNSTVNGKTYYGKMLLDSTAGNPTLNFSGAAANALTISVNSADYADLKESYKIIELADPDSTLDMTKISITVDGAAYTLGTTLADRYSINQVENDLVLTYTPPPAMTLYDKDGKFVLETSSMDEVVSTTVGGDYRLVFNGEATGSASLKLAAANLTIAGTGMFTVPTTFWVGNASTQATNLTIEAGSDITATITSASGGLNFRYQTEDTNAGREKVASSLTVDNARLCTTAEMPTNGLITVKGAGVAGNYGFKKGETYVANLEVFNTITTKDRFNVLEGNVSMNISDYAWVQGGTLNISTDDTGNKAIVILNNSKMTLGNNEQSGTMTISVKDGEFRVIGDSVFSGKLAFSQAGIFSINGLNADIKVGSITDANKVGTVAIAFDSKDITGDKTIIEVTGDGEYAAGKTTITIDGTEQTLGSKFMIGDKYYQVALGAAGTDGVANDLMLTEAAPPALSATKADGTAAGVFDLLLDAAAAAGDGGTITFTGNVLDTNTYSDDSFKISNNLTLEGTGVYEFENFRGTYVWIGEGTASNLTIAEGADISFLKVSGNGLNFRYKKENNVETDTAELHVNNGRFYLGGSINSNGLISVSGSGVAGNYGFKKGDAYVANLEATANPSIGIKDRLGLNKDAVIVVKDYGYIKVDSIRLTISGSYLSHTSVTDSKLEIYGLKGLAFEGAGNMLKISGDSEVILSKANFMKAGAIAITGIDSIVQVGTLENAASGALNFTFTSAQLDALRSGASQALFEITGEGTDTLATTITVDGTALTVGDDGTYTSGDYVFSWAAAGEDGIANDFVVTSKAPAISVTTESGAFGKYDTLWGAIDTINRDSGNGPYTLKFNGDTTDGGSTVYIQKDVVFSGSAKLDKLTLWIGDSSKTKVAHVLFSEGSEFVINNTDALNGRYLSDKSAASTMTVDNASVKVNEFSMNGPLVINGNGTGKADASGNIYGFLKDGTYQENFISSGMTVLDLANANNGMGLQLTDYAWVKTNGSNYITLKNDKPTTVSIENSRLDVAGYIKFDANGGIIQISGDSVFTAGQLGYGANSTVSKTGSINVSGLDAEITVGKISSAVTAINFTVTGKELMSMSGDSMVLFELTDAAAAFDANTAISFKVDDKSYGVGEKFMINNELYKVALGGTDSNDLILAKLDPYMISDTAYTTDTILDGTAKAYYNDPADTKPLLVSVYNGATLTVATDTTVDVKSTKSYVLVGGQSHFGGEANGTGAGTLVVNGTMKAGHLNVESDGTAVIVGTVDIPEICIDDSNKTGNSGKLIVNGGSVRAAWLNTISTGATATFNGLSELTLTEGGGFHLYSNPADAVTFSITDADLAKMTGVSHTLINATDERTNVEGMFTVKVNGAAYTLGTEFADAAGNKYVIQMAAIGDDMVANDLEILLTEKAPEPVIPEEPGEGGEGGMEIAAQNPPVFINPKYSEKTTGKKVNGVELEYGVNAFSSIEDAKAALGADAAVSMVVNKSAKFDSESDLSGISEIAGNSPVEKATVKSTPKKSLTLNGTTAAATDFRQFSKVKVLNGANIGGDIINEKFTIKFKGTKDANGEWLDGVATTTNAAVGTLKVTDSTIANAFGFKSVKLTNSQAGILGVNPVAKEVATIEGGAVASTEIVKEKRVGTVTAKDSIVDSVMDYKTLKLQGESAVASIENVQNVSISGKADVQINDLTDTANLNNKFTVGSKAIVDLGIGNFGAGNDKMTIGSKATVYADSLDFGEGKDSLKISGTLVLENGMLEGIEKISGRGEIATTAAYADALDERYDDVFGGEILDLGNTVANFRGTKNELADNTEKKALKWDTAEGELGGWLGIGDDVDCIDSVDFVKITASKDGTLEISSAAWNGSSDIVTLDGVSLDITGGSASFGITAGEDYLLKIERKDNNSMSYDIKLA